MQNTTQGRQAERDLAGGLEPNLQLGQGRIGVSGDVLAQVRALRGIQFRRRTAGMGQGMRVARLLPPHNALQVAQADAEGTGQGGFRQRLRIHRRQQLLAQIV